MTVGAARVSPAPADEPGTRLVDLHVDPAWQRRGVGTRLLGDASRLARTLGADEVRLTARSDNQAVLPMVMAAGMRGRIRMAGEVLTVRIVVRDLLPIARTGAGRHGVGPVGPRMRWWNSPRNSPPSV